MDHEGPMGPPDVTGRRDRLVAALLTAEPGQVLLRLDAEVAVLYGTTEGRRIVALTVPEGLPQDRLAYAFSAHVKTVTKGSPPTHFVVMGGGPEASAALKQAAPFVQSAPMGFHHIDGHGGYSHAAGQRLPVLERAWAGLDPTGPLDRPILADALARGQALVTQEQAVVARLQGRFRVTAAIVATCVVLLGLSYLWGVGAHDAALFRMGAGSGERLRQGEVWRLFSSAFLHANLVHLGMNMVALWSLGPMLESILGPRRYVLLYGATALGGSLASGLLGADLTRWSVGASGAVWGLMAATLALAMRPNGVLPPRMAQQMKGRLGTAVVINLGISMVPGIDLRAHLGGGVVGFALMATVLTRGLTPLEQRATPADAERASSPVLSVAAALMTAAMALSILAALVTGRPWEVSAAPALQRTAIGDTGLTLELPSAIAGDVHEVKSKSRRFTFGGLNDAPVMFEVIIAELSEAIPADQLDESMDGLRKTLDEHGPPKAVRKGPARRMKLGERQAVMVEHTLEGLHLETYVEVIGTHEVFVRGYSREDRPAAWRGIEEKVAATLAAR